MWGARVRGGLLLSPPLCPVSFSLLFSPPLISSHPFSSLLPSPFNSFHLSPSLFSRVSPSVPSFLWSSLSISSLVFPPHLRPFLVFFLCCFFLILSIFLFSYFLYLPLSFTIQDVNGRPLRVNVAGGKKSTLCQEWGYWPFPRFVTSSALFCIESIARVSTYLLYRSVTPSARSRMGSAVPSACFLFARLPLVPFSCYRFLSLLLCAPLAQAFNLCPPCASDFSFSNLSIFLPLNLLLLLPFPRSKFLSQTYLRFF